MHAETLVRIGKNGITDNVVEEVNKHLKKRGVVKVQLLPNIVGRSGKRELAEELANRTGSGMLSIVGFTVTLKKKASRK